MNDQEVRRRLVEDFELFCETCLKVEAKDQSGLVGLQLKPVQRRLAQKILEIWHEGRPVRLIVLKARREGVSTLVQAFFYWRCSTRPHQKSLTLAHDDDGSQTLHGMSERFYENVPDLIRPSRKVAQSGKILAFANPSSKPVVRKENPGLGSEMRTVTRQNAGAGKGAKYLHASEVGLWGDSAKETLGTILQTIPRAPETVVVLESTARGVGNEFYERWMKAESGESEYVPFFIAWFEEPENRLDPPPDYRPDEDEEEWLQHEYGLDHAQLWWRRRVIEDECGGDLDLFHQEYPATPEQAFLSTGRPYFNMVAVGRHLDHARLATPIAVGDIEEVEGHRRVRLYQHPRGRVKIWEAPDEHDDYLIFADSSEGSTGDPQAAYVFSRSKLEIVASWHGRVDRDLFGHELFRLGVLYRFALVAVEVTGGWGYTPLAILKERHYPRLYSSKTEERRNRKRGVSLGWKTTPASRALMLDALGQALRQDDLVCNDPDLLVECSTFVYDEKGKPAAQPGKHDDRVMAAAGGVYLWLNESRRSEEAPAPKRRVLSEVAGY